MNNKVTQLLFLLIFCCNFAANAQIDADIETITYYQDGSPFVDVNLHIVGSSLNQKKAELEQVESRVNVLITVLQGDKIIDFRKYGLISPRATVATDFIDKKRFSLEPGSYTLQIDLSDQLNTTNKNTFSKEINVEAFSNGLFISEPQLLYDVQASEDKSNPFFNYGNILYPTSFNFFHSKLNKFIVFCEIYGINTIETDKVVTRVTIKSQDESDFKPLVKYKKIEKKEKEILFSSFNIEKLPSGNYTVDIDILDADQKILLTKNESFQRSNPAYDAQAIMNDELDLDKTFVGNLTSEELIYNLKALAPILKQADVNVLNILLSENNVNAQKFFLFNYWNTYNPVDPEHSFNQYLEIAEAVDRKFYSTVGRGFETDRGYIFLRYGRPNNIISVENEPSAPPYEIWFYDKLDLTGETNMKFLFYNPTLGGNDYTLLHSTSRYEKQNRQWELELYSDAPNEIDGNRVDATTVVDNNNRRAREYFEDNN